MDTPKPKPFPKNDIKKVDRPKSRLKSKPREVKTRNRKVEWEIIMPESSKKITVNAETEIEAVETVFNTYGVIPERVTRKNKKDFVLSDHLTHRPFSNLENLLKGV